MIFPEGLHSKEDFDKFAAAMRKLPGPAPGGGPFMLANMTEFGKTPYLTLNEFAGLGYHCVIYPVSTLRSAMKGVNECLVELKSKGTLEAFLPRMYSRKELYTTLEYTPGVEWKFPAQPSQEKS